jgi:hypothetical protein
MGRLVAGAVVGIAVNERAHSADRDSAFSQHIREGLPLPHVMPPAGKNF